MTQFSRIFIASMFLAFALPSSAHAAIGKQPEFISSSSSSASSVSSSSSESSISTGVLLEMQQEEALWQERRERHPEFWLKMMNHRKEVSAYRKQHQIRRQKRKEKRIACRIDVRKANRDSILSVTFGCFRATLTLDLEILRKQKQHIEDLPNISESTKVHAVSAIDNLSDAISTMIGAIDAGVYASKEALEESKQNLAATYRKPLREAVLRLRIDRTSQWINHLLLRFKTIADTDLPDDVAVTIDDTIACFELQETALLSLLEQEDSDALIDDFRQVQSDLKFCIELAVEAKTLNTEFEQAEAKEEE